MNQALSSGQRARTDEQKQIRRRIILESAESHLADVGFESFSMAAVGRLAGVAKGTLYLYFETREDLMLALFCEKLEQCAVKFVNTLPTVASDLEFASAYYDTLIADPVYLPLASRMDSVIEHNVSTEALVAAKRTMADTINRMSLSVSHTLSLSADQTFDAILSCASLWLGAAQTDAGPSSDNRELPEDVRQIMRQFSSRNLFTTNACRILHGIRAGL